MIVKRLLRRLPHPHVIRADGYATGAPDRYGHRQVTALGYRCVLCGGYFDCVTEQGIRQLAAGGPPLEVFEWATY